jgi:hypothetical protein
LYGEYRYYSCRVKDFNCECEQKAVSCDDLEDQVVQILTHLKPLQEWRSHITQAMSSILGERNLEERLAEIKAAIERMDFRWDQGFIIDKMDYLEKRVKLQQELESLTPIADDDLERVVDMLRNFKKHWDACHGDVEEQHKLVKLIMERIYVQDNHVAAIMLKADYHIVLGHNANEPTEFSIDSFVSTNGDDGGQFLACIHLIPPYYQKNHVMFSHIVTRVWGRTLTVSYPMTAAVIFPVPLPKRLSPTSASRQWRFPSIV